MTEANNTPVFKAITLDVSKKENGAFKKVGEMVVHCPTLMDLLPFINSPVKKDEKGVEVYEEGMPVFEDARANWVQGAILAMVKAQARNKLVPGSADVKPGLKIAENWDELTAEGVRDGAGLAIAREARAAFAEWVNKQGLSEKAAQTLIALFGNKTALQLQQQSTKDKVKARVEAFAESLKEEQLEKFTRPLESILEACNATEETADF